MQGPSHKDKRGEWKWLCKCECGNETIVYGSHLRNGDTLSCGCIMKNTKRTHSQSNTRLYRIWLHVKNRCNNPNFDHYKCYGGRGITYCKEWNNFEPFMEWALSNGYKDNLTIDRIDVNGNYCPENCRWITGKEQHKNTRKTIIIEHNGIEDTLLGWSKRLGIPKSTLQARYRRGCNIFE